MQVPGVADALAEAGAELGLERGLEVQPRHLVLVLVGHELEEVPRHRLRQPGAARHLLDLRLGHPLHHLHVPARVGQILVRDQLGHAPLEKAPQLGARRRRLDRVDQGAGVPLQRDRRHLAAGGGADRRLHALDIHHRHAPPAESEEVHLHRDAVEADRALDARRRDRERARLVGRPQHERIGRHVVVEEPFRHGLGIEIDVVILASDAVDIEQGAAQLGEVHGGVHHHLPGGDLTGGDDGDGASRLRLVEVIGIGGDEEVEAQVEVGPARGHLVGGHQRPRGHLEVGDDGAALLAEPGLVEPAHVPAVQQRRGAEDLAHRHHAGAADAHHVDGEPVGAHLDHGIGQHDLEWRQALLLLRRLAHVLNGQE